jgi:hypothetical protein
MTERQAADVLLPVIFAWLERRKDPLLAPGSGERNWLCHIGTANGRRGAAEATVQNRTLPCGSGAMVES